MIKKTGKREQNKERNRQKVLEAARVVFMDIGYDAATVRDIIRLTDLASGTFYNYFPDKEAVFRSLIEDFIQRVATKVLSVRKRAITLKGFVGDAYLAFFQGIAEDPDSYELARRNENILSSLYQRSMVELFSVPLLKDIRRAIRFGLMPKTDPEYLAAAFVGTANEMSRSMVTSRQVNPEQAAEFATSLFLGGIQNLPQVGKKAGRRR